jgi:hypothetical protein
LCKINDKSQNCRCGGEALWCRRFLMVSWQFTDITLHVALFDHPARIHDFGGGARRHGI